ncbi:UDP-N-acetylglucosamine 1-carboxyvinyltransferase [Patescibacteria group bacterium]|nr:MAG: UDP-N-acetylglucosamine 1-carboxyvinyltransferase [Patescibacteria group bacterium]
MSKFIIQGGNPLRGKVKISGSKNAATPIIAATLLTREKCVLENVPKIRDVNNLLDILKGMGADVNWLDEHKLEIQCKDIALEKLDRKAVKKMRSSVLLLGPILARFRSIENFPEPGGCIIGNRPLDAHFAALKALGAEIEVDGNRGAYSMRAEKLANAEIILPEFSVTATENLLMAASLISGKTIIRGAAVEPHVQDLIKFLNSLGAKIIFSGQHEITVDGAEKLNGAKHTIIPDQIEIGTFAAAAAATRGDIEIESVDLAHLDLIILKLKQIGVQIEIGDGKLRVSTDGSLRSFRLQTMPYPGFPTDLQAPFGLLATQAIGTSLIHDPLFEGRMGYVGELVKMGANAVVCDPHRVLITGATPLYGTEIRSLDLRAGATLILAGLAAEGETVIHDAEIVERGYERFDERLRSLGAAIAKID